MTANVRCAGYGIGTRTAAGGTPCGWKGERLPSWPKDHVIGEPQPNTDKPCPRCGGRVELIPQDGA